MPVKSRDFVVGIPAGHLSYTAFFSHFFRWISGNTVSPMIAESNRVDVNRSQIIQLAKEKHLNVIFMDSDALPQTTYPELERYLLEDFEKYDIVVAPVRGMNGQLLIRPKSADFKYPQHKDELKPFEIEAGSFTLAGISYNLLEKLTPLSQYGLVDNRFVPLYVAYTTQTSEEYAFCKKAIKTYHSKIACDPRIKVSHFKPIPLEPPLTIEESEERRKAYENMMQEAKANGKFVG
jgi:hypothetical protein